MARSRAAALLAERPVGAIVLLGGKVCAAFGLAFEPFTWRSHEARRLVMLPHPSGLCRLWHERGAFERARSVLREAGVLPGLATPVSP